MAQAAHLSWQRSRWFSASLAMGAIGLAGLGAVAVIEHRLTHNFFTFLFIVGVFAMQITVYVEAHAALELSHSRRSRCCCCCKSRGLLLRPGSVSPRLFRMLSACVVAVVLMGVAGIVCGALYLSGSPIDGLLAWAVIEHLFLVAEAAFLIAVSGSVERVGGNGLNVKEGELQQRGGAQSAA